MRPRGRNRCQINIDVYVRIDVTTGDQIDIRFNNQNEEHTCLGRPKAGGLPKRIPVQARSLFKALIEARS